VDFRYRNPADSLGAYRSEVFTSVAAALRADFQMYDRALDGYVAQIKTAAGWALALVDEKRAA